jgi:predicted amidohydrolase YtcJ
MSALRALLCLLPLALAPAALAQDADLLLEHGKIVTVDERFSIVEAVAIKGERVVATGSAAELEAAHKGTATKIVDLHGRTVIPGLIDGHIHFLRGAEFWQSEVRFQGMTRRAQAVAALRDRVAAVGPGTWVLEVGGWSEDQFADDQRPFTRAELDTLAPDNPVYLQVGYGRAYANSTALEKAGIALVDAAASDRELVERDDKGAATGKLTGPRGFGLVRRVLPKAEGDDRSAGLRAMSQALNAQGVTAVLDPGGFGVKPADYAPLEAMALAGQSTVRVFRALWLDTADLAAVPQTVEAIRQAQGFQGDDWYDLIAIGECVYSPLHDSFRRPLKPSPDERDAIRRLFDAAAERGFPFHIHAIEHDTIDVYLDAIEEVAKTRNIRPLRWTIAHAWTISPDQIVRMRRLGLTLALQDGSSFDASRVRLAGESGYAMPPLAEIADSGLPWGLGTDATVVGQLDPFITLGWAVTGTMPSGRTTNKMPVSREAALIAHTRTNAYLLFRENALGSIEPGKLADLVVLDRDYLTVPAAEIFAIKPAATMVGGKLVFGGFD